MKGKLLPFGFSVVLFVCALFGICSSAKPKCIEITFYYDNVCSSCDIEGEFLTLFHKKLDDVLKDVPYELRMVNTFLEEESFSKQCHIMNIPTDEQNLPMLVVGRRYVTSEHNIEMLLRPLFCMEAQIKDECSLWYFYRPDCKDCERIESIIQKIPEEYPSRNFIIIDTTNPLAKEKFKHALANRKIPSEEWQVPFLWDTHGYLSGDQSIFENWQDFLRN